MSGSAGSALVDEHAETSLKRMLAMATLGVVGLRGWRPGDSGGPPASRSKRRADEIDSGGDHRRRRGWRSRGLLSRRQRPRGRVRGGAQRRRSLRYARDRLLGPSTSTVDLGAQFFHPDTHPLYVTLLEQLGLYDPARPDADDTLAAPASLCIFPSRRRPSSLFVGAPAVDAAAGARVPRISATCAARGSL